jgi:tRNA dimethylallyltransferase
METDHRPKIVVICGATGVGKTSGAIELALRLDGEIVGADAMQIYRHMDIGTAKPTAAEQARVAHHMIDVVDPDEPYDAARYARDARAVIDTLLRRGKVPLVVGGTGFYIRALTGGLFEAAPADLDIRRRLQETHRQIGSQALYRQLSRCDPATAGRLHPNDSYRVIRALEVFEATGRPLGELQRRHRFADRPYTVLTLGLHRERDALYQRIDARVEAMMAAGFVEEVRRLLDRGYGPELKSMQSLGYRHVAAWLAGRFNRTDAVTLMKRDTRRYAKRQLTWFRHLDGIQWIPPDRLADQHDQIRRLLDVRPCVTPAMPGEGGKMADGIDTIRK